MSEILNTTKSNKKPVSAPTPTKVVTGAKVGQIVLYCVNENDEIIHKAAIVHSVSKIDSTILNLNVMMEGYMTLVKGVSLSLDGPISGHWIYA